MTPDRRLIEEVLPIKSISAEASREKSIRHGHISTLHIWWARRPLVACRAALLGVLLRDPGPGKKRDGLVEFIEKFCTWEASNDPKMVERARTLILEHNGGVPPKVLDCFAGGGAIPLEALRVGCEAHALDLNPVAHLIELCTLVYPQKYGKPAEVEDAQGGLHGKKTVPNRLAYDVERWGRWVLAEARKEIGELYPADSDGSIPIAYLWALTLRCPNPKCGAEVPLVRQLWLANKRKKKVALKMVPDSKKKRVGFEVAEGREVNFNPIEGTMKLGGMLCPVCKEGSFTKLTIKQEARKNGFGIQPLAVALADPKVGKRYRTFAKGDIDIFSKAVEKRRRLASQKFDGCYVIPDETISRDYDWVLKPPMFGLVRFGDLFNARQAVAIATFVAKVRDAFGLVKEECGDEEYAKAVATYLALTLDKNIDRLSTVCLWHNTQEKLEHVFGRQAIPMAWDYAEGNPLDGNWNFEWALEWTLKAIEHCSVLRASCEARQSSATRIPYPDGFFSAVVTDPPYYDQVPYADLSDFFYVWLKRMVGPLYSELFATPLTPKAEEIVEQSGKVTSAKQRKKDKAFFERQMGLVFREMNRVLKPSGACAVVFAHKTTTAWETLIGALIEAGFSVSGSWPLHTEMTTRLRARESAALASSTWLVCRKRDPRAPVGSWKEVQADLEARAKERMEFFLSQGIRGADALLSAIGPALEVFGRYSKVEKVTGEAVTVGEFLDKVREVVSHHALAVALKGQEIGAVDPPTAFYVLWKWSHEGREEAPATTASTNDGNENDDETEESEGEEKPKQKAPGRTKIPADDAFKLAHSVGAEFDELIRPGGILRKEGENALLLGPEDRKGVKDLGKASRDGRPPPLIDVLHRAVNLWVAGEQGALGEYLEESGAGTIENLWTIAGALSRILPPGSEEKNRIDGLWGRYGGGTPTGAGTPRGGKAQVRLDRFKEQV